MFRNIKTKILLTVFAIVLLFTFFTLYYFPLQQGRAIMKNYKNEVQNFAKTVALGVKIAIEEQNFAGVQTALDFVKGTPGLKFVSLIQIDTIWDKDHNLIAVKETLFKTFPEKYEPDSGMVSSESIIVKQAPFQTTMMSGNITLGFTSDEIISGQKYVKRISLYVSAGIFIVGMLIGLLLARHISVPVRTLRDAAYRVGKGDFSPVTAKFPKDEIGDLSIAFNTMVADLSKAKDLQTKNLTLTESNKLLNEAMAELKATQSQLIQSEKMASLGEMTAGIAHEIQNPLNFVNNFSEVNKELIDEMEQEIEKGNYEEAKNIAGHIRENQEKINQHGKRADGIVKGMLQHSRSGNNIKEPTDINALADEYFRLAYHGLRAKDKSFNANTKTEFDTSLEKINIVPQDIGRVILNLVTNAFYAVTEKKKFSSESYEPTVTVTTNKLGNKVEVKVKDNGNGIPQKVLDKIFQPFFTTKPTGKGTGLGLSLSYDIVKAHGGEIKVTTKENEGSEFVISLLA